MRKFICLTSLLLVAGCASIGTLQHDQTLHLGPDEGVAAIIIDTSQPLSHFSLHSTGHFGHPLDIPAVPSGKSLYLFRVRAARYCVQGFAYGKESYNANGDLGCFSVPARQLGYSGVLMPMFEYSYAFGLRTTRFRVRVVDDVRLFRHLLKQDYPKVAAQLLPQFVPSNSHLTGLKKMAVAQSTRTKDSCDASKPTCWWTERASDSGQAIVIQNNSVFPVWIWTARLYACVNVKRTCEALIFNVKLPAKTARPFLIVKPRDPAHGFSYYFHYAWHRQAAKEVMKKPETAAD